MYKTMVLCAGRHNIPEAIDGAILPTSVDPTDLPGISATVAEKLRSVEDLTLYVTGLTVAVVEVIKFCQAHNIGLMLMHYDRTTGDYYPQRATWGLPTCPFCGEPWNNIADTYCSHCGAS